MAWTVKLSQFRGSPVLQGVTWEVYWKTYDLEHESDWIPGICILAKLLKYVERIWSTGGCLGIAIKSTPATHSRSMLAHTRSPSQTWEVGGQRVPFCSNKASRCKVTDSDWLAWHCPGFTIETLASWLSLWSREHRNAWSLSEVTLCILKFRKHGKEFVLQLRKWRPGQEAVCLLYTTSWWPCILAA